MFERIRTIRRALAEGRDEEDGFTLIELLIVIVVIGILAAVTVFGLSGTASQSAQSACKADARTVEVAIQAWHTNDPAGGWPPYAANMASLVNPGGVVQPYIRSAVTSPHYTITWAVDGTVSVTPTATGTPLTFDNPPPGDAANVCNLVK
jgi:prepilin-type N-terminal cleavage/methylation domain-containing protein